MAQFETCLLTRRIFIMQTCFFPFKHYFSFMSCWRHVKSTLLESQKGLYLHNEVLCEPSWLLQLPPWTNFYVAVITLIILGIFAVKLYADILKRERAPCLKQLLKAVQNKCVNPRVLIRLALCILIHKLKAGMNSEKCFL